MQGLTETQSTVMRRAGLVLAVIGLLDIASCAFAFAQGASYSSSLNIFALVAGILVYRGSTESARFVVRGLSFLLGAFLLLPLLIPLVIPPRLLWLLLKTSPLAALEGVGLVGALIALLFWVRRQLGSLPLYPGGTQAPPLYRSPAAGVGAGIPLLLAVVLPAALHGEFGRRAVDEARRKVGPGYSFCVRELSTAGRSGSAVVIAYTDTEVREVAVEWKE